MVLSAQFSFVLAVLFVGGFPSVRSQPKIVWGTVGLTSGQLVSRISQGAGQPFILVAGPTPPVSHRRLFCTSGVLPVATAIALAERAFGLAAWDLDGTRIWLQNKDAPGLVSADISRAVDERILATFGAELATGDLDMDKANAAEAIRRVGLAFEVVFVYSEKCVGSDRRLSLAMDDVDFETCLSILQERFGFRSTRVGGAVFLESADEVRRAGRRATDPDVRMAPNAVDARRGCVGLFESRRLDREEGATLCSRIEGNG